MSGLLYIARKLELDLVKLSADNMAAILRKMCMLGVFDDNEEDFLVQIATRSRNAAFLQISLRNEIEGCQKIYYSFL